MATPAPSEPCFCVASEVAAPRIDDVTAARTEYIRVEMIVKISTSGMKKTLDRFFEQAGCRTARRSCEGRPARLALRRNDGQA
jgi:hypothetical protein